MKNIYKDYIKRILDFLLSLVALLCLSPLLLVVTIWLHFANKGAGAFFLQDRPGRNGKIFKIIKYKTMTDERDADGKLLPDSVRLTRVGRFVRSTSIDELPQVLNILNGTMSVIGPRPDPPDWFRCKNIRPPSASWRRQTHPPSVSFWNECRSYARRQRPVSVPPDPRHFSKRPNYYIRDF